MTTRTHVDGRSTRASTLLATALLLGSAAVAGAQERQVASTDTRWTPWVGCWQASARDLESRGVSPGSQAPLSVICIVPAAGAAAVDLVTVTGAQVAAPERVDANGAKRAVSREGCEGWETAEFSPDAKRIYLRSEHQCTGNRTRTSTGIMSISPAGEWLDIQGVKVDANNAVRVAHYGRVPIPAALSADMRAVLEGQKLAQNTAVLAASDSISIADVIEASKRTDPLVLQAWLTERGQGFNMNARRLAEVSDAKVPGGVIDVMVALSYPRAFAINLAGRDGQVVAAQQTASAETESSRYDDQVVYMNWDPFYSSRYDRYGYGFYNRYGMYGGGGFYPGTWYVPGNVPIVVRPSTQPAPADTRGRMVKGSGYTRPSDRRGDGGGQPRTSVSDGSGSGSSKAGSSGGSSSSGGERTAKPRSP